MAYEDAKNYLEKAIKDEELRTRLEGKEPDEAAVMAKELGFDVSAEEIVQAERDLRISSTEVNIELSPEDLDKAAGGYWWAADDSPIDGHELFCIFTWHDSSWSKEHDDWCTKNYIFKKWVQKD